MRRSTREVWDSMQRQNGGFELSNRERQRRTDAARAVPEWRKNAIKIPVQRVQKEEHQGSTSCRLDKKRCDPKSDAEKRLLKSRVLSTSPPELGTSNVSGTKFERDHLSRLDEEGEIQAEAEHLKRAESSQKWRKPAERNQFDTRSNMMRQCSTASISSRSRRTCSTEAEAHKRSTSTSPTRNGCHEHTPAHLNCREADSQEPYILTKGNRYTEHEQRHGSTNREENFNVKSFQFTVLHDDEMYHRADLMAVFCARRNNATPSFSCDLKRRNNATPL